MWDETNQTKDVDCESLQLAVKLGILGVILQVVWILVNIYLQWVSVELSYDVYLDMIKLSAIGIIHAVFVSVGFVAIFAMKGSRLGIVFPLMVILARLWPYFYVRVSYPLGLYSADFHIQSNVILGIAITIIGGLALLSIRNRSRNRAFFTMFAIFYLVRDFLLYVIWLIIFGGLGPVQIFTGLDVLITSLPTLLVGFAFTILAIIFFIIESKQGCVGLDSTSATI